MTGERREIRVSRDRMHQDAEEWRKAAEVFRRAYEVAAGLSLTADDFSGPADQLGATETYRELQEKLARYLDEGSTFFEDTADRLDLIATRWKQVEDEQSERMEQFLQRVEEIGR